MDVFGPVWERHAERIVANWTRVVGDDDVVLVPGDISWALKLEDALVDLRMLAELPGRRKILLKGNHDYWWTSRGKVEAVLPPTMELLQNDCVDLGSGVGVVGTRGWSPPSSPHAKPEDEKIFKRELGRLEMSLKAAAGRFDRTIAMLHYPPTYRGFGDTEFAGLLEEAGVDTLRVWPSARRGSPAGGARRPPHDPLRVRRRRRGRLHTRRSRRRALRLRVRVHSFARIWMPQRRTRRREEGPSRFSTRSDYQPTRDREVGDRARFRSSRRPLRLCGVP